MEKLLGDLSGRHGSRCRDGGAGDVGAAGHGVGGHQLRRRHHDWFLLLGRWREKSALECCRPSGGLSECVKDTFAFPLTESASILKLYLEHLHRRGDNNLAHASTATRQHLFEHGQTLTAGRQETYCKSLLTGIITPFFF